MIDPKTGEHKPKTMHFGPEGKQVEICPRVPVRALMNDAIKMLPVRYMEALEHNQLIKSCCRHPENHDIIAFKSHPDLDDPDIYQFICDQCGNVHTRFLCEGVAFSDIHDEFKHEPARVPYWG